jgi:hypothetical protein
MHEALMVYFQGEKHAGLALAALGLAVGAGALSFLRYSGQFKALALTLGVWALLQLAIGLGLYLKTGPQVAGLAQSFQQQPSETRASETKRMARVQQAFVIIEGVWLALIIASAGVAIWKKAELTPNGIALGMLVNCSFLLTFDLIAERRGGIYLAALQAGPAAGASSAAP